jgi:hypothetical protein
MSQAGAYELQIKCLKVQNKELIEQLHCAIWWIAQHNKELSYEVILDRIKNVIPQALGADKIEESA